MRKVIAIGQSAFEIVCIDGKPGASYIGGRIANMALSLGKAGTATEFVSECGCDIPGDLIADTFKANNVSTTSVDRYPDGLTPVSLVFKSGTEISRSLYTKYPAQHRFDIQWPKIYENDIVVFGSSFAVEQDVHRPLLELLRYAVDRKAVIVYLPGLEHDQTNVVRNMPAIFENLEFADIVITRESDMARIFSKHSPEQCYRENIAFYSPNFVFASDSGSVTVLAPQCNLAVPCGLTPPANRLGWDSALCAGIVFGLIEHEVTRADIANIPEGAWKKVMDTASRFVADCTATGANTISNNLADSLRQTYGIHSPENLHVAIRPENESDRPYVSQLIAAAFRETAAGLHNEPALVEQLRSTGAFIPQFALVAEVHGHIAGYLLMTRADITADDGTSVPSLALAPLAVMPGLQGKGIGRQLVSDAHRRAALMGFKSAIVLGDPAYYGKFGYRPASDFGIRLPFGPPEYGLAVELVPNGLLGISGTVNYAEPFYMK